MKRYFFLSLLVLMLILLYIVIANRQTSQVSALELLGKGNMTTYSIRAYKLGVVHAWGWWIILEHMNSKDTSQCVIIPIDSISRLIAFRVYCEKYYLKPNRFNGFIYFRGHERPFCGGVSLPRVCLKIGEVIHGLR